MGMDILKNSGKTEAETTSLAAPDLLKIATRNMKSAKMIANLSDYVQHHHVYPETRVLRDKQFDVMDDTLTFFEKGETRGYIVLPTGLGKTVIGIELIKAINPTKSLIIVPTNQLVDQTIERFKQFGPRIEVGRIDKVKREFGKQVTVTTYASLMKNLANHSIEPTDYDLVLLDEAHRSLGKKTTQSIDRFSEETTIIGFTATPEYSPSRHVGLVLKNQIHNLGIVEAAKNGYISSFRAILALTEINIDNVRISSNGDYNPLDLEREIDYSAIGKAAAKLYHHDLFNGKKCVMFCPGVKSAEQVALRLNQEGISAGVVHGYQKTREQREVLKKFERGEISVITNSDILKEGFDDPKVEAIFNLRPTTSKLMVIQRAGRGLRSDANNPNKVAAVVDFVFESKDRIGQSLTFAQVVGRAAVLSERWARREQVLDDDSPEAFVIKMESDKPELSVHGIKVIVKPTEVMRVLNERELKGKKFNDAPEKWVPAAELVRKGITTSGLMYTYTKRYKNDKEMLGDYLLSGTNIVALFISPKLLDLLIKETRDIPKTHVPITALSEKLGVTNHALLAFIKRKFGNELIVRVGRRMQYVPNAIVKSLQDQIRELSVQPGEKSLSKISKELHISTNALKRLVKNELGNNALKLREFGGNKGQYLSPSDIKKIEKIAENRTVKEGEMVLYQLRKNTGLAPQTLKALLNEKIGDNALKFREFGGRSGYYISAADAHKIERIAQEGKTKPGEVSLFSLSLKFEINHQTLLKAIKKELGSEVLQHRRFGGTGGYYLSKEDAEKMEKIVSENKVRPGEKSLNKISEEFDIGDRTLKHLAKKELGSNSLRWRGFGATAGYYLSPDDAERLSKIVLERKAKIGEVSIGKLSEEVKISPQTLQRIIERDLGSTILKWREFGTVPGFFVSFEDAQKIRETIAQYVTLTEVANEIGVSRPLLIRFVNQRFEGALIRGIAGISVEKGRFYLKKDVAEQIKIAYKQEKGAI